MKTSSFTKSKGTDPEQVKRNVDVITGGASFAPNDIKGLSPIPIPEFGQEQAAQFFAHMFAPDDRVNVIPMRNSAGQGKMITSPGVTFAAKKYIRSLETEQWDTTDAGYLYTINALSGIPSGKRGFYTDADCVSHRYLLAECDVLPLNKQAALLVRLPLPIKAIVTSGSRSLHAIIEVNAEDKVAYRKVARGLLRELDRLGFDRSCSNSTRKSRLPGFTRRPEPKGAPANQELLYLNPNPTGEAIV